MYTLFQQETKNIDWYFVILAFYYICTFIDAGVIRNYSRKARKNEKWNHNSKKRHQNCDPNLHSYCKLVRELVRKA